MVILLERESFSIPLSHRRWFAFHLATVVSGWKVMNRQIREIIQMAEAYASRTSIIFHLICGCSVTQSCPALCDPMDGNTPGFPVLQCLPEFDQTHVRSADDAIQLSRPLPSIFPSNRVFSNKLALHVRWPKYWSFSFSISPSNDYSGLISFRMDWLDLLAVQGTLKSLLQHHSLKASILQCSAFFMVQLSHPYMTTGKTIALTIWTFVGEVRYELSIV